MQIGVFAKTFAGNCPEPVLTACKTAGFKSVQYNMSCSGLPSLPESISRERAEEVRRASQVTGINVAAVSATYNMTHPDADQRLAGRRGFAAIAQNAARMGTDLLTLCTGSMDAEDQWRRHRANDDPGTWIEMCREFEVVLEHADQHDLVVGVEPEHANVVSTARRALRLLESFPGSAIRIVLDPANLLEDVPLELQSDTLAEAIELLGPAIVIVHAKDRFADGRVAPAGLGTVDWGRFLAGLSRIDFQGPLVAHGMSADQAPAVAAYLQDQLERL